MWKPDNDLQNDSRRPTKRILRTQAAAEYLGLSPSTLEKRRLAGGGPRSIPLLGRAVGYAIEDLDAWIEQQRDIGTADEKAPEDVA